MRQNEVRSEDGVFFRLKNAGILPNDMTVLYSKRIAWHNFFLNQEGRCQLLLFSSKNC